MNFVRTGKTVAFCLVLALVFSVVLAPISKQVSERGDTVSSAAGRTAVEAKTVAAVPHGVVNEAATVSQKTHNEPPVTHKTTPTTTMTASDRELLARLVTAEAGAEPYEGQVAVAHVVINRMNSSRFPNTISGVVYQTSQFEPVQNGTINRPATGSARQAVNDALRGWDPSHGALYFWDPAKVSNSYLWSRPVTTIIGGHRFTE